MPTFERYELRDEGNQKNVILYLSRNETEFGKEPGVKDKEEELQTSVRDTVRSKFPNLKLNTAKVMMGTVLIASVSRMARTRRRRKRSSVRTARSVRRLM